MKSAPFNCDNLFLNFGIISDFQVIVNTLIYFSLDQNTTKFKLIERGKIELTNLHDNLLGFFICLNQFCHLHINDLLYKDNYLSVFPLDSGSLIH